jgi:hypothetical protein
MMLLRRFLEEHRRRKRDARWYANRGADRPKRPRNRQPVEPPEGARIPEPEPTPPRPVSPFVLLYHESKWDNPYVVAHGACHSICVQKHEPGDDIDSPCWAVFLRLGSSRSQNPGTRPSHLWNDLGQPDWFKAAFVENPG